MIYLDYAAATPIDPRVLKAQEPYFIDKFFNPSASYMAAREVRADYEEARHRIAQIIGGRSSEVIFTAGATESVNLAINGVKGGIITTAIEHPSVLRAATERDGVILPVDNKGRLNLTKLRESIGDETELISVSYANSEIGTTQAMRDIAEIVTEIRRDRLARDVRSPLLFHTDASQAAGYLDINTARSGVDLMTLNSGKCYGPKQVGVLFVRSGVELIPLINGGGQEMGLRSGTENVAGAVGFARALEIADKKRRTEVKRIGALRDGLESFVKDQFPGVVINGHPKYRLPNVLNFSIPHLDGERAVFALDMQGVLLATGSACAANKGLRSHVLKGIGLSDDLADGSLRISLGRPTSEAEIDELKPILAQVIGEQLKFGASND